MAYYIRNLTLFNVDRQYETSNRLNTLAVQAIYYQLGLRACLHAIVQVANKLDVRLLYSVPPQTPFIA